MRVTEYEIIIQEAIHIPARGEKQDFIQVQNPSGLVLMCIVVNIIHYISIYIFY